MTYPLTTCISITFTSFFGGFVVGMLFFWSSFFLRWLLGFGRSLVNGDIKF